jgi:1-acyl-sn-glycerol-3-phosphate acyltransferase
MGPSDMLIIYPEGTRFTPARRARTLEQLRARGPSPALALAESLQHTLPPLRKGPLALLAENPGAHLLIVGHAGFEGTGSFAELTRGELCGKEIRVRSWLVPFDSIPREEEARIALLSDHWRKIDAFIDEHQPRSEALLSAPAAAE